VLITDSIDENAFNQIPDIVSGADLIEDDLPTNLDYLDTANRPQQRLSTDRSTGETLRSWQTTDEHDTYEAEANGEMIRILWDDPIDMKRDYWDSMSVVNEGFADE
jgi:autophagy-related protein 2